MIVRLLAALVVIAPATACAMPDKPVRHAGEALAGVVLDRTITVAGHEFYKQFCMFWHDMPMNERFAIAIHERLSARRGNQVVVEYAGQVLFQGTLPPARADVRPLSQLAAEMAHDTAANAEIRRLLFSDDELAPDEL